MRDIKFRAWDTKAGGWIAEQYLSISAHGTPMVYDDGRFRLRQQTVVLQQFTGLHDKNGKEIYEGDILDMRYDSDSADEHLYVPVEFNLGTFWAGSVLLLEDYDEVRGVVGNIYENPELLEGR